MAPLKQLLCAGFSTGLALALVCCSGDPAPSPGRGGSGGVANSGGSAAQSGSSSGGQSGGNGQPGGGVTGGGGQAPGAGGSAGTSGSGTGGSAGTAGAGVQGGSGGAGGSGGGASVGPDWECPPGPFPAPVAGQVENLCAGFDYDFNYLEGPTWVKAQNALYFSNFDILKGEHGDIIKYTLGGQCERFTTEVGCNGLAVGASGKLLAACQQSRSVLSFDLATKASTTLASMHMGKLLDTPNDLVVRSNGAVYFTNRTAELDGRPVDFGSAVFWIDPAGTLAMIEKGDGNGIALSPDERTLYVNNLATWQLDENGVPGAKLPKLVDGDGLAVDCAGNLYQSGGQIKNPQGQVIGNFPGGTNMAFGGPEGTTLFVVSGGSNVRAVSMNVPGIP